MDQQLEIATLGGGCFWCVEAVFNEVQGVVEAVSGYCNGHVVNPSYEDVCGGDTGHVEAVRITFDPRVISYVEILGIFFSIHDPTTLNRQGNDSGPQYRSGIYTHTDEQARLARATIAHLNQEKIWPAVIVTEVVAAETFYVAEEYHQRFFARNPGQGYCMAVVSPKLAKFRRKFVARLKK